MSLLSSRAVFSGLAILGSVACGAEEAAFFGSVDASSDGQDAPTGTSGRAGNPGSAGSSGAAGDGGSGTAREDGAAPNQDSARDAANEAGSSDGRGAGNPDAAPDASDAASDACTNPTAYYADSDNDGYGSSASVIRACSPPATGHWVSRPGDCNDQDSRVRPGQAAYFGTPYGTVNGQSYDYDCSGTEQGDPSQTTAPENCGLLSLTLCAGSGYTRTTRTGQGISPYCGSLEINTCRAAIAVLICETVTETATEPYRCK